MLLNIWFDDLDSGLEMGRGVRGGCSLEEQSDMKAH